MPSGYGPIERVSVPIENIDKEIYLNFNHRAQRVIIYNLLLLIWSIPNVLYYSNVLSTSSSTTKIYDYGTSISDLLLIFHSMLTLASIIIIFTTYYQISSSNKNDISLINISITIHGHRIDLPIIDGINVAVGFIYFVSFLFHIGITWKMVDNVCTDDNNLSDYWCHTTIVSSTLFGILYPLLLSIDIIDNFLRNPNKRILLLCLFIFISSFLFILAFDHYDFSQNIYYLSSYIKFSQISWWLVCCATFIVYIIEGFYHEGKLKKYIEIMISFILMCSSMVAFGTNIITLPVNDAVNNDYIVIIHQSWFLILVLSIFVSYDIQKLDSFNLNIIGGQSTMRERLITAPETDFGINTPSVYKKTRPIQLVDNIDDNGDDIKTNDIGAAGGSRSRSNSSFSYLIFKAYSFNFNDKKQRLIILNCLLLIFSVSRFIYYFNFWINWDTKELNNIRNREENVNNYSMHLDKVGYEWYCLSFCLMIVVSVVVIIMEWFLIDNDSSRSNTNRLYSYLCGFIYIISGVIQSIAVSYNSHYYCSHDQNSHKFTGSTYYCHTQYIGAQLLSILLPICILSVDVLSIIPIAFNHPRVRCTVYNFVISLVSLLIYIGYYNYIDDKDISSYKKTQLTGLLLITYSFLLSSVISVLFLYLKSKIFETLSNLLAGILIIVGIGFAFDINGVGVNTSEWSLFIPIACLVAYEIQTLSIKTV